MNCETLTLKFSMFFMIPNLNQNNLSYDNACICKLCNHGFARNCIKANCNCCNNRDNSSHSMVLDGIEGFTYKASDRKVDE